MAVSLLMLTAACSRKTPVAQSAPAPAPAPSQTASAPAPSRSTGNSSTASNTTPSRATDDQLRSAIKEMNKALEGAYFDFDKYSLRPEAMTALTNGANFLKGAMQEDSSLRLTVEGHADERGSSEYNLALGDRRAQQVKEFLATLGIPGDRLQTVSQGEERPVCTEASEGCWQKNRRANLDYKRN
ncbi:MAG: OmpA family protein [Bryobacterales bacterium]|nr:OmpA family protein [Bryobacterales bacterium]